MFLMAQSSAFSFVLQILMSALQVINVTAALRVPIPMDLTYVLATAATPETDELVEVVLISLNDLTAIVMTKTDLMRMVDANLTPPGVPQGQICAQREIQ